LTIGNAYDIIRLCKTMNEQNPAKGIYLPLSLRLVLWQRPAQV
jgi:hypothetical protein